MTDKIVIAPLRRGQFVRVTSAHGMVRGMVGLASENGRSIMLFFDGMIGGWAGAAPAFQNDAGQWTTLDGITLVITLQESGE